MTTSGLGVPVKLLHESLGHVITVELKTGQLYRGKLAEGTIQDTYFNNLAAYMLSWFYLDSTFQLKITSTSR